MNIKICSFLVFGLLCGQVLWARPTQVVDLLAIPTNGAVILYWTSPTPSVSTTLTNIDVRYDTSAFNGQSSTVWASKPQITWLTDPGTPGTLQMAVVTDLTPNTTYYFALKTQDSSGALSSMSNLALATVGGPTYFVSLMWNPSTSAEVSGYKIYYGTASQTYTNTTLVGNVTTCNVSNLVWGVTYYFAATSVDTNGDESAFSNEATIIRP